MSEQQPWLRQPNEPLLWFRRFTNYRLMAPKRSIALVFQAEDIAKKREKPRTKPTGDWYSMAALWKWEERAEAYDAFLREVEEAEIDRIMHEGYAATYKRVQALDRVAREMEKPYVNDQGKTRQLHYNPERLREWRGILDDIAQETGGRVKKSEVHAKVHATGRVGVYLPQKYQIEVATPLAKPEESGSISIDEQRDASDGDRSATAE